MECGGAAAICRASHWFSSKTGLKCLFEGHRWLPSLFSNTTCKELDARSLRGGGGELDKLKTLTYGFIIFS
jgi:hypothetical protein